VKPAAIISAALFGAGLITAPARAAGGGDEGGSIVVTIAEERARRGGGDWVEGMARGREKAVRAGLPLLVFATSRGVGVCAMQDAALEEPEIAAALSEWICIRLDVESNAEDAHSIGIVGLPALRAMTPVGEVVEKQEGYIAGEALETWLESAREKANKAWPGGAALAAEGALSAETVTALIALLGHRGSEVRAAAVDRLARDPEGCAARVVEAFFEGSLAVRLSCLEILETWEAPVAGADPWRPRTVEEAAEHIEAWLSAGEFALALPSRAEIDADFRALIEGDAERARGAMARLARIGPDLIGEVRERLAAENRDAPRERLTLLRYRLVLPPRLVRERPALLLALASTVARERASAVERIAAEGGDLEAFFIELFSDPDPLVREVALRGLRRTAGSRANEALAGLLADPQPNVRAQVLRELAEAPSAAAVGILASYVKSEKDDDLVAHAVRSLAAVKKPAAVKVLVPLGGHRSWQVRADVAEALGASRYWGPPYRLRPDAAGALLSLLGDDDPFVVSKAMDAVEGSNVDAVVQLAEVAERFAQLAPRALEVMATNARTRGKAVQYLRGFTDHEKADVRAAALTALVTCTQSNISAQLETAFGDGESAVRRAAAVAIKTLTEDADSVAPQVVERWRKPLEAMLDAENAEERCSAAAALVSLRVFDGAVEALKSVSAENSELRDEVAETLSFLPWELRKGLFEHLLSLDLSQTAVRVTLDGIAAGAPAKAARTLWGLVGEDERVLEEASAASDAIIKSYFGEEGRWDASVRAPAKVRALSEAARARVDSADDRVRALALGLLCMSDPPAAGREAERIFVESETSDQMRLNAFRALVMLDPDGQVQRAASAVAARDETLLEAAVGFLSLGSSTDSSGVLWAGESSVYVYATREEFEAPEIPESITVEVLKPLLSHSDAGVRAHSAYLLARLGDTSGLDTLAEAWRRSGGYTERELLIKAITGLSADSYTPVLEEIYESMDKAEDLWDIRTFYWSIRPMAGPKVLALRKRVRDEVGAQILR